MNRRLYILLFATVLTGCASIEIPPLDDAYYWPDKKSSAVSAAPVAPPATHVQTSPSLEYVNVKDTVVTVRIKR